MPAIGKRCHELRIVDTVASWRIVYHVATDAIVILDVFAKQTRTTPTVVIRRCARRLRAYLAALDEGGVMDVRRRKKLEAAGFRVGTADDFLGLTPEESALLDLKSSLGAVVRTARQRARLSQQALASRIRSSQSRIAKLEAGDARVSLDLIVRAALAAGAKRAELAAAIVERKRRAAG